MPDNLTAARRAVGERSWKQAVDFYVAADTAGPLASSDLEALALASYMIGRDDDMIVAYERAHQLHLDAGDVLPAVRAAFWIGLNLAFRGEMGPASGWFGRAGRLLGDYGKGCAEAGYLLMPGVIQAHETGDYEAGYEIAARAIEIGRRFAEPDLVALALHAQGRILVRAGQASEGLRLLDEAMVAVGADDLFPIVTGIIYCSVIEECYEVQDIRRANEWTSALSGWCGTQPEMVAFTGQCLTHRAEIMQLRGEWTEALQEAERATGRFVDGMNQTPVAQAFYRQGELFRLRGELAAAEQAYRAASRWGWEPQPGLALLRLAQGDAGAARTTLERVVAETDDWVHEVRILPALVEVALAQGDIDAARQFSEGLDVVAVEHPTPMLLAAADYVRGAVLVAVGSPERAATALGKARKTWVGLEAPYEVARVRFQLGLAYQQLGDHDTGQLEFEAAAATFESLGAIPDLARLHRVSGQRVIAGSGDLTDRELEVLRLVATGKTNRAIADELFLSERTIDRHLSNVFTKLGVTSRTAAAAYIHERKLL